MGLEGAKSWVYDRLTLYWTKQWIVEIQDLIYTDWDGEKVSIFLCSQIVALAEQFTIEGSNRWNLWVLKASLTFTEQIVPEND